MALSETVMYLIIFSLTVLFSVFSLVLAENRLFLKLTAALCWFILALTTIILNTDMSIIPNAMSFLFAGFGVIFCLSTVQDWVGEKKGAFEREIAD